LARHSDDAITAAINTAINADPAAFAPDPELQAAVGRSLTQVEWQGPRPRWPRPGVWW
jgi:hypothetical protein